MMWSNASRAAGESSSAAYQVTIHPQIEHLDDEHLTQVPGLFAAVRHAGCSPELAVEKVV